MTRSYKKGPFIDFKLLAKVEKLKTTYPAPAPTVLGCQEHQELCAKVAGKKL